MLMQINVHTTRVRHHIHRVTIDVIQTAERVDSRSVRWHNFVDKVVLRR